MKLKQLLSIVLVIILLVNMALFGLRKASGVYFWLVTGIIAVIAYLVMPKVK